MKAFAGRLTNGRTILEDMAQRPVDGLHTAQQMASTWNSSAMAAAVKDAVGEVFYSTVAAQLTAFATSAASQVETVHGRIAKLHPKEMARLGLAGE